MVRASYQTTIVIAINGVAPFLYIPLANVYGRRPLYLFCTLLGFATALGCAYAKTFGQLLVARAFNGFMSVAFALGAATVVDLFFFHQRGRAMGVYTVTMVNGSHLAPIIGGLVGQFLGWRWCFKMAAIFNVSGLSAWPHCMTSSDGIAGRHVRCHILLPAGDTVCSPPVQQSCANQAHNGIPGLCPAS